LFVLANEETAKGNERNFSNGRGLFPMNKFVIQLQINILKNHDETDCDVKIYANGFPSMDDAKRFVSAIQDLLETNGINYEKQELKAPS
jgi:hypothetical protein